MHPYKTFPAKQFWSRAVSQGFDATQAPNAEKPLLMSSDKIVTAGSCFAANLVPYLEKNGFEYLRTEYNHPIFREVPTENLSYAKFSAGYGNIYTARQMLQLLKRCLGEFTPVEDRWVTPDGIIDPFRPGLLYRARTEREFDLLTKQHLQAALRAFQECDVLIFTLGLTEGWISKADGAVFPACPGTIAGTYDDSKHGFVNFTVAEVTDDLRDFITVLRRINPSVRVLLTVSPVPLVATASDRHVLPATVYSKSVLRVAAEVIANEMDQVTYFPAYEIVTGPQAPADFFEADKRNVTVKAVDTVMSAFLANCETSTHAFLERKADVVPQNNADKIGALSRRLMDLDCEEAGQDA
ncbi:GSCFA domain-containing protein [Pararhizobium gei]|uniref:GSCFA domain-containing protein n=1 Tax=Pararhizobium gei TaxID=1395951 RepID=UPI0023D9F240|nr:GSCFA domain-containing protein [Rhizobium gei]